MHIAVKLYSEQHHVNSQEYSGRDSELADVVGAVGEQDEDAGREDEVETVGEGVAVQDEGYSQHGGCCVVCR